MNIKRLAILTGTVLLGISLVLLLLLSSLYSNLTVAHAAGPWYVTPGGNDSNSCLAADAPCATINGAISKASGGDTIYAAIGTYTGTGDEVVLIDKDITLSGGWDATFTSQSSTSTIDGEDSRRGITVSSNVTTTVTHFTVQNGYTDSGNGGGIHNSGTLTISDSVINDNFAFYVGYGDHGGGGIYNIGTLTLIKSNVSNNTASDNGGGIYGTSGSSNIIMDSQIYANMAINVSGGGVEMDSGSDLNMYRSWVVGNDALNNDGGGVGFNYGGSGYIENSIIAGNITTDTGGGLFFVEGGPYRVVNSNIIGNWSGSEGAAIVINTSQIEVTNTLIISNKGSTGIDTQWDSGAVFLLSYCDTYGNSPDGTVEVTITRTNCLGTPPEDGLDPLMAGGTLPVGVGLDNPEEWLSYDYRLLPGSPAIDAGTPIDAPLTDIEGTPRDATPDMGAYEYSPPGALKFIYLPVITR